MTLQFDLQRNGFPIEIGGISFFFGTTTENLRDFYLRQSEYSKKRLEVEKRAVELPELTIDENEPDGLAKATDAIHQAMELTKELTKLDYDALLGDGSFDKIYTVCPDTEQLAAAFDDIAEAVEQAIEKDGEKRNEAFKAKKAAILKKKALKKKK